MADFNAPKPVRNPAQLALISSIVAPALAVVAAVFNGGVVTILGILVYLLVSGLAILFAALKQPIPLIVVGGLLTIYGLLTAVINAVSGYWSYDVVGSLLNLLTLGASVAIVVFAVQFIGSAKAQPKNEVAPAQVFVPAGPSDRKWVTALLLSLFFGVLGFDRLYVGRTGLAIAKLLTGGGLLIWALVDFILLCLGKMNDVHGRQLQR